ncbi:MAG: nucleoside phosphorylase [Saprospiraceae bacterium]|uniref:Nucleoside phosphorylase n=1 Tax=Candidatus Opimibacter skivensis TaxID=2982028 RepID=A0A9D7SZ12_9BACT|nr:nucleoside phosphorylase [Candidatus Opimibacter skivensis]
MNESELILNPDGSVYHLSLRPEEIANTIILVGDQDRVPKVSKYFDRIDLEKQKREFVTHTGWIGAKRITVVSTGIGTDNIDIVINELDALANINFNTRQINPSLQSLSLIRIGTSGSIHHDVKLDDIVISKYAIGTDALGHYYDVEKQPHPLLPSWSYLTGRYAFDLNKFPFEFIEGITLTCPGFYNPQGRILRITPAYNIPLDELTSIKINNTHITNMEMETSGIYLLAHLLGHKAISFNAILAQRLDGKFSSNPDKIIDELIQHVLKWITLNP